METDGGLTRASIWRGVADRGGLSSFQVLGLRHRIGSGWKCDSGKGLLCSRTHCSADRVSPKEDYKARAGRSDITQEKMLLVFPWLCPRLFAYRHAALPAASSSVTRFRPSPPPSFFPTSSPARIGLPPPPPPASPAVCLPSPIFFLSTMAVASGCE